MRGLGILILIVLFFWLVWPTLSRWLRRKAAERAEDYMRSRMGMPPRDRKKRNYDGGNDSRESYYYRKTGNAGTSHSGSNEPLIPKEYAEDVEFTEMKEYSPSERSATRDNVRIYHESQISDAEWTEIKKSGSK